MIKKRREYGSGRKKEENMRVVYSIGWFSHLSTCPHRSHPKQTTFYNSFVTDGCQLNHFHRSTFDSFALQNGLFTHQTSLFVLISIRFSKQCVCYTRAIFTWWSISLNQWFNRLTLDAGTNSMESAIDRDESASLLLQRDRERERGSCAKILSGTQKQQHGLFITLSISLKFQVQAKDRHSIYSQTQMLLYKVEFWKVPRSIQNIEWFGSNQRACV